MPFLLTFSPCEWVCVFKRTTPNPVRRLRACERGICGRSSTFPHFVTEWMGLCCSVGRIESSLTKCNYYDQVEWECRRTDGRTTGFGGRVVVLRWGFGGKLKYKNYPNAICSNGFLIFRAGDVRKIWNFITKIRLNFQSTPKELSRPVAKWLLDRFNASPNSLNGHVE